MKRKHTSILILGLLMNMILHAQDISWEKDLIKNLDKLADSLTLNLTHWEVPKSIFKVEDYGAIADSLTLNTKAIQKAIDACTYSGGGTVLFSQGNYVTGTIILKSNVQIEIAKDAKILGSTNLIDYPEKIESHRSLLKELYLFRQSLIYAEDAINISIKGPGEIYFRGEKENFSGPQSGTTIKKRPLGIRMFECKNVQVQNISLRNSASWMQAYACCENLLFNGVKVYNQGNYNNDGLDIINGSRNVIVKNCYFNTEDDAMCFKGLSEDVTENILIENSTFFSTCNSLKIGTETQGSFKNIIARNLILGGVPDSFITFNGRHNSSTGISLITADGGNVEKIVISDINISRTNCPIFIIVDNRGRVLKNTPKPNPGYFKHVVIEDIIGEDNLSQGSLITGMQGYPVEDILIRNMNLRIKGEGTAEMIYLPVIESNGGYPDAFRFSQTGLPSYGFYIRHAKNILLNKINVVPEKDDNRPLFKSGGDIKNVVGNGVIVK